MNEQVREANGMASEDLPEFLKRNAPASKEGKKEGEEGQKGESDKQPT